jgi:SnoaL-like domain
MRQVDQRALGELLDKQAIAELVQLERFWRDRGNWEELAGCYTDDSRVKTTWFEGTGQAFAEASRKMAQQGRHSTHPITPVQIRLNGDRALVESVAEIHNRGTLDSVEVDMVMECRFFCRVRRTAEGWRFVTFDGIYHKDSIVAVNPADELPVDWDEIRRLRPSYRIWSYAMARRGYDVSEEELGDDRPDLLEPFYRAAEHWLATGDENCR